MLRFFVVAVLLLTHASLVAQPTEASIEWKDGKKYFVHFVQAGNTLYGLTRTYQVSAEEIVAANPELENGLKVGQKLLIPAASGDPVKPTEQTAKHTVQKSETVYGIAKSYNLTIEELVKANPGIENGVSLGQVLTIPGKKGNEQVVSKPTTPATATITFSDTTIQHTVLDHETLYSISKRFMVPIEEIQKANNLKSTKIKPGDTILIPVKKEKITPVAIRKVEPVREAKVDEDILFKKKSKYTVVLFLPFNLDRGKDAVTSIATEFLMGAQLALDSLEKLGLYADVHVIDVPSDTTKFKQVFSRAEVKNADLIIGPFLGNPVKITARWCKANKIQMVNPLISETEVLLGNQYVSNAATSDITLIEGLAEFTNKNYGQAQVVLVKTPEKDNDLYQAYRKRFMDLAAKGNKQKLIEISPADLATYIKKTGTTVVVFPTRDKVAATKLVNSLAKSNGKTSADIVLMGTKEWVGFDDIKAFYKNRFQFHYASSNDLNYAYPETQKLLRLYRKAYNADMSKYGAQGFDVAYYFLATKLLDKKVTKGVMNDMRMRSTGPGNGQENKSYFILKQVNYEIINLTEAGNE